MTEANPTMIDPGPGEHERAAAVAAIRANDKSWKESGELLSVGSLRWRPDLQARKERVLHLALGGEIPRAWMRRMQAASTAGYQVTVGLGPRVASTATLSQIQSFDGRIVALDVTDDGTYKARDFRSVADWIAADRISLLPEDLQLLAGERFNEAVAEPTNVKGRLYEEALCLLFSQVSWLTVDEHAYRNSSEEIDLVLGVHAIGHVAALAKGAIAIATAKNESKPTSSQTVKYLKEQVANRKGRCNLGFLCSATKISSDAQREILRGSQRDDIVLAELNGDDFRELLKQADDLDNAMVALVRRATVD